MGFRTSKRVSEEVAVRKLYFRPIPNWRRSQRRTLLLWKSCATIKILLPTREDFELTERRSLPIIVCTSIPWQAQTLVFERSLA
jgi:hypothetical protein